MTPRSLRPTSEARQELALDLKRKYDAGRSIRSLAAEYECAYGTVRNYLLLVKTRLRKRGGGLPKRRAVTQQQTGGRS